MIDPTLHFSDSVLNEYLDGELDHAGQAALEAHLPVCQDCSRRLAELKTLFLSLENLPEESPSRDLASAVQAALRNQPAGPRQRWILAAGTALQLVLAAAALTWLVPAQAWRDLPAGWGLALLPSEMQLLLVRLTSIGLNRTFDSIWIGLNASLLSGMNMIFQEWQTVQAGLAQSVHTQAQAGLGQTPILELSLIGLAVTLVWLAGNGLLIGSLNRKSRRRNL